VTSIVSTVLSSDDFLMVILPLSASTASLKVKTIFASIRMSVPLSVGLEDERVGLDSSAVVKLKAVVLDIPA
jgi:hypothetical protein